jgi:hypothetical protein
MEFAEQERRPEQVVTPEYQSVSPESSEPTLKELTNGADYSKMPKAFQKSHFFELPSAPAQEKAQGQSNADAPVAKTGENSDSELLGGTVAPPILLAGGLGGALPAPKNPLQSAGKSFRKRSGCIRKRRGCIRKRRCCLRSVRSGRRARRSHLGLAAFSASGRRKRSGVGA